MWRIVEDPNREQPSIHTKTGVLSLKKEGMVKAWWLHIVIKKLYTVLYVTVHSGFLCTKNWRLERSHRCLRRSLSGHLKVFKLSQNQFGQSFLSKIFLWFGLKTNKKCHFLSFFLSFLVVWLYFLSFFFLASIAFSCDDHKTRPRCERILGVRHRNTSLACLQR